MNSDIREIGNYLKEKINKTKYFNMSVNNDNGSYEFNEYDFFDSTTIENNMGDLDCSFLDIYVNMDEVYIPSIIFIAIGVEKDKSYYMYTSLYLDNGDDLIESGILKTYNKPSIQMIDDIIETSAQYISKYYNKAPYLKKYVYDLLGKSYEEIKSEEIIDKDFIYKIDDSNKFTVELDYDNIDEFINAEPTGDTRQDTIKICTIDTKIPIIQIQKTNKKSEIIFLVDLCTEDRREFKTKAYMQTKEEFNQLLQETIDMLNSSPEFCKYASDLEDFVK